MMWCLKAMHRALGFSWSMPMVVMEITHGKGCLLAWDQQPCEDGATQTQKPLLSSCSSEVESLQC